ncbi:hypothetical protein [Pumilibacter muris]|uniref:hypothetical protein n=1 Tax=Pumilibacter muris TaxID=2941510 RepID=UPI00203AAF64|nr:hypothetical protein [Pumilibacter muris]
MSDVVAQKKTESEHEAEKMMNDTTRELRGDKKSFVPSGGNGKTMNNTLKCVIVLALIALVCVSLLAFANKFMKVEITLDKATSSLINKIAPTGVDDDAAFGERHIQLVDLSKGGYAVSDLDAYNKTYGTSTQKVRALYTSKNVNTGKVTLVVEAEGKGHVDAIVLLIAYDDDNKISGVAVKSQAESYWDKLEGRQDVFDAFIGMSGNITHSQIATSTGATNSLRGMADAASIANGFVARARGESSSAPTEETDEAKLSQLRKVSDASKFTRYTVGTATVANVFKGDNGDVVVEARGDGGSYGKVTLLVRVAGGKVEKVARVPGTDSFDPTDNNDSSVFRNDAVLNEIFVGKTLQEVSGLPENGLAGTTGVTESGRGLISAVKNALEYAASFNSEEKGE